MDAFPSEIGCARLQRAPAGLQVVLPPYERWFRLLLAPISLVSILGSIGQWAEGSWVVYTVIGVLAAHVFAVWLWKMAGRQVLMLNSTALTVYWVFIGFSHKRTYFVDRISNLHFAPRARWTAEQMGDRGCLAFDYELRTVPLEGRLGAGEAQELIGVLNCWGHAPLSAIHAKRELAHKAAITLQEVHRGPGAIVAFSMMACLLYYLVSFADSAPLKGAAIAIGALLLGLGVAAETGYRYCFSKSGVGVYLFGARLELIPLEQIIRFEISKWTYSDGRNLLMLPGRHCYLWGGAGVRIHTVSGRVFLGHDMRRKSWMI